MKIRIVKASEPTYWYADKIGEVFETIEYNELYGAYLTDAVFENPGERGYIGSEDCEEVIEHNSQLYRKVDRPVREGDTVLITDAYMAYGMYKNGDVIRCDGLKNSFRGGIYSKEISNPNGNAVGLVTKDEFVVIEPIEQPSLNAPSYAEVSELLHEAKGEPKEESDLITHNGKQYRKVKRKAAVGELVVVTNAENHATDYGNGDVYTITAVHGNDVEFNDRAGDPNGLYEREYHVLELVEQSGQSETLTELDLIANLAQEVAELKRELHRLKGAVSDNETDIADLEDRVDENEKDVEEVIELAVDNQTEILELDATVDEITARINDVSEAMVPVEVIENVIAELRELEGHAEKLCDHYEDNGIKELAQFQDGKSHAFLDAQKLLKEALRNA